MPKLEMTALILCGGQSKRMGRAKAFLPYAGSTIIGHLVEEMENLFDEVLLVANEPDSYLDLGPDVVRDMLPNRGPLCGILSGLLTAKHDRVFVTACDMPLFNQDLICNMEKESSGFDITVLAHEERLEPLIGIYSKNCVKELEESLFEDKLSLTELISNHKNAHKFYCKYEDRLAPDLPPYFNVNTPSDYSKLLAK
ncbi:MAG: molybdenum cofactor guanylyltransferase [Candidatus Melainabacteria bacterium]|nr:molybdenum cofactor guanylyltransferase [Candidatus Melainabacteria bacterium]